MDVARVRQTHHSAKISFVHYTLHAAVLLCCCCSSLIAQQQFSADQASNAISMLLKQDLASACDGEQLHIKCNDDYVIEILTAELTVLAKEHHQRPAPTSRPQSLLSGNQSETDSPQEGQLICPPLSVDVPTDSNETKTDLKICDDQQAHELASTRVQPKLLSAVRKHCALLNSCTLDFRIAASSNHGTTANQADFESTTASSNITELMRPLNDKCASNRKLLEVIYKCRPSKVKSRAVCRNGRLALECPPGETNKRLAIGSAVYGFWNDDKKTHEKCLAEEERLRTSGTMSEWQLTQSQAVTSQLVNTRNCSTLNSQPSRVVADECLFKQQCQIQLKPELFRNPQADPLASTTCPQNQLEYLKVIYVCINEELLITTNASHLRSSQPRSSMNLVSVGKETSELPFSPSSVSSSSLLSSGSSRLNLTTPSTNQNGISQPPQMVAEPAESSKSTPKSKRTNEDQSLAPVGSSGGQPNQLTGPQEPRSTGGQLWPSTNSGAGRSASILDDPEMSRLPWHKWTFGQRLKVELYRLQGPIIGLSVITLTVFTLSAFLVRACSSSRSRNSNVSSSSKSSNSSSKSFGSSTTDYTASQHSQITAGGGASHKATVASQQLMSAGGLTSNALQQFNYKHHQHKHHEHVQRPTNSCSESCFSLDDYNCHQNNQIQRPPPLQLPYLCHTNATNSTSSPNNSPALQSHHTTPPISANEHLGAQPSDWLMQQQQQQQPQQQQQARPKFWSFYGNEQHSNSLRLGHQHEFGAGSQAQQQLAASTLRPSQRNFGLAGRQQPTLARNFQCLQQPTAHQQGGLEGQQAALEPHQGDYLLAMACVQQLQQTPASWQQQRQQNCDSVSHHELVDSHADRLQFAQLDANELAAANQALLGTIQGQQTCAFHAQQQQQFQAMANGQVAAGPAGSAGSIGDSKLAQSQAPTLLPPSGP